MNYDDMSIEDLETENIRLSNERTAIRAEQVRLRAVLDQKLRLREAALKLEMMDDAEKAALAQVIGVDAAQAKVSANNG